MKLAPVMFVGHGSPMFAIEQSHARDLLEQHQSVFDEVKAIVVVSAHWVTNGFIGVTSDKAPQTIHDFGGFPTELYQLEYPAQGSPELANAIQDLLKKRGFRFSSKLNAVSIMVFGSVDAFGAKRQYSSDSSVY